MFIVKPRIKNKSEHQVGMKFGQWLKSHIAYLFIGNNLHLYEDKQATEKSSPSSKATTPTTKPSATPKDKPESPILLAFREALWRTYPCNGYDVGTQLITDFAGTVIPYDGKLAFIPLLLTSFLGLPNRPKNLEHFSTETESKYSAHLHINPLIILFNFFGGWDFSENISTEKTVWQWFSLIPKIFIIFPLNVISIPFKIALNIVKIFSEFLPTFTSFLLTYAYQKLFLAREASENTGKKRLYSLGLVICSFFHFLTKTLSLIGRAMTSPENSARLAVAFSYEIKGKILGIKTGTIIGFFAGAFSVALTATLWAFTLPLVISAALKFFPSLMNTAYQMVLWVSNLPVIAQTLNILNATFVTIIAGLHSIIAPVVMPLASLMSLEVSAAVLYIGIALGLLAFPVTLFSRIATHLNNAWLKWHEGGPIETCFSPAEKESGVHSKSTYFHSPSKQKNNRMTSAHAVQSGMKLEKSLDAATRASSISTSDGYNATSTSVFQCPDHREPQPQHQPHPKSQSTLK